MSKDKRVKCTISFFYDPETYLFYEEFDNPSESEILKRCKEMFIEDITSAIDPLSTEFVIAEFINENSNS